MVFRKVDQLLLRGTQEQQEKASCETTKRLTAEANRVADIQAGKVQEVRFLTPAKVDVESLSGEHKVTYSVLVDLVNRKVYKKDCSPANPWLSEKIFAHLDEVNTLPEDFFIAPQEITEEAEKAQKSYEAMQSQTLGVASE